MNMLIGLLIAGAITGVLTEQVDHRYGNPLLSTVTFLMLVTIGTIVVLGVTA